MYQNRTQSGWIFQISFHVIKYVRLSFSYFVCHFSLSRSQVHHAWILVANLLSSSSYRSIRKCYWKFRLHVCMYDVCKILFVDNCRQSVCDLFIENQLMTEVDIDAALTKRCIQAAVMIKWFDLHFNFLCKCENHIDSVSFN